MGKQEDKGVVAIVCSFPFISDGKKGMSALSTVCFKMVFISALVHKIQQSSKYAGKKMFVF